MHVMHVPKVCRLPILHAWESFFKHKGLQMGWQRQQLLPDTLGPYVTAKQLAS